MGQETVIIEQSTFDTSTSFSSSLDNTQYNHVYSYLKEEIGDPDLSKGKIQIWLKHNENEDEYFEIKLIENKEVVVKYKSEKNNTAARKKIDQLIEDISRIVQN